MKIVLLAVFAATAFTSAASAQRIDVTIERPQQKVTIERQKQYVTIERTKIYVDLTVCRQYLDNFRTPDATTRIVCGTK